MANNANAGTIPWIRVLALIYCEAHGYPETSAPHFEYMLLSKLDETMRAKVQRTVPMYEAQQTIERARQDLPGWRRYFDNPEQLPS